MDIKIHYIEKGQGKPIILLHGNSEDSKYFVGQIDVLAERYHVYALDSRGHGKTPFGDKKLTIKQLAEDLDDFIEEHKLHRPHILGFSDGANVAIVYALNHSDNVDKVILNGGNLVPEGIVDKVLASIKRHYDKALQDQEKDEKASKKARRFSLMVNDPYIDKNDLINIKNPALVIAGSKDMIKEEHTKEIAKYLANAELSIIEGDHFIAKNQADKFNEIIIDFLEK